jgi:hypothetical protein
VSSLNNSHRLGVDQSEETSFKERAQLAKCPERPPAAVRDYQLFLNSGLYRSETIKSLNASSAGNLFNPGMSEDAS